MYAIRNLYTSLLILLVPLSAPPTTKKQKSKPQTVELPKLRDVQCREWLGGLLKHYYRTAA